MIIYKVWLMKNKNCPTSTTLLLLSTLCVGTEAGLAQEFRETFFEHLLLLAISVA